MERERSRLLAEPAANLNEAQPQGIELHARDADLDRGGAGQRTSIERFFGRVLVLFALRARLCSAGPLSRRAWR